jgi:hypothetical protein
MYNEHSGDCGTSVFDDLDRMRLRSEELPGPSSTHLPVQEVQTDVVKRRCSRDAFIRGPFPLPLVCIAGKLPGKALLVWLLINHRIRMSHQPEITLPNRFLASAGADPRAKARALVALEHAGLIRVRREPGKTARIALKLIPSDRPVGG